LKTGSFEPGGFTPGKGMNMIKISGFTFVRNAVQTEYPVVESISSILPIVDEFIVNVGPDEDGTLDLIQSIADPKIKILQSQWNPNMNTGAYVYAQQTNIALFNCMGKWAFYLQADEVIHEEDHPVIVDYMDKYIDDNRVEGLALRQLNFWGDYDTIVNIYPQRGRRRCWIVKPHRFVMSRGDAAGFTVHPKYDERGHKLRVIDTGARLFHYCNVKSERALEEKIRTIQRYWSEKNLEGLDLDYYRLLPRQFVAEYTGTHPEVMTERIRNHPVSIDLSSPLWRTQFTWKERKQLLKDKFVRHVTDRFSGRGSYKLLKK
jgi:glycosyltransferase involved in cell wall biosynthesis